MMTPDDESNGADQQVVDINAANSDIPRGEPPATSKDGDHEVVPASANACDLAERDDVVAVAAAPVDAAVTNDEHGIIDNDTSSGEHAPENNEETKQSHEPGVDQPTTQAVSAEQQQEHSASAAVQTELPSPQQRPQDPPAGHTIDPPGDHHKISNDVERQATKNYTSAPTSVLGTDVDKHDFHRGQGMSDPSSSDNNPSTNSTSGGNDSAGAAATFTKLKEWFAPLTTAPSPSSPSRDENSNGDTEYRNFSSPGGSPKKDKAANNASINNTTSSKGMDNIRKAINNNSHKFEESLLHDEENGDVELSSSSCAKSPNRRRWGQSSPSGASAMEEEQVMGKCSFFYDMNNLPQNDTPAAAIPTDSHRIPETEPPDNAEPLDDDEAQKAYFDQQHTRYYYTRGRIRILHPRAMAHAIQTRAKRRWTERRYRRRLRQSQHALPIGRRRFFANEESSPTCSSVASARAVDEFTYELTTEHRRAFHAAHAALNGKLANEYGRNRHAIRKQYGYDDYDLDYDLDLEEGGGGGDNNNNDARSRSGGVEEEIRADLTKSSLAIRGGLIRMPTDNVRLVCDAQLQPGILSIETRDVPPLLKEARGGNGDEEKKEVHRMMGYEGYGNANRYGNIHGNGTSPLRRNSSKESLVSSSDHHTQHWSRNELAYVLTVDEDIYRRVVQEIGDSHRIPCGMYYCCHESESGDHVGIGVAICVLLGVFALLVMGMVAWPTW